MITLPLSYFWDFFPRRGRMYLLWSSSLFSMYHTVEAMTLGTTMGLCCLHFSSALLTYSLASCWMQDFPMSYGNTLWEDRESRASSALRSPPSFVISGRYTTMVPWLQPREGTVCPATLQVLTACETFGHISYPSGGKPALWTASSHLEVSCSVNALF